jgi:hypothetical protein
MAMSLETPMPSVPLGRLERAELRSAWVSESSHFTPWLAGDDNITLLGEAIGLELEVESTEKGVGPFRADILCKDRATSHYVLIENQLEQTDHLHLGQLLTYAAGLEAVTIVWVAQRFTDEHRAAVDWLNRITDSAFNFFALEIELWRIGDSPLAPKFNVVSKPNDWGRAVKVSSGQEGPVSSTQQLHLEFWTQFREFMEQRKSPVRVGKPSTDHWKTFPVGRSNFELFAVNGMRDGYSAVYLSLMGPSAKPHFHLLRQDHKDKIDATLGSDVNWRELPNKSESQVMLRRDSTPADKATWPDLNAWFAEKLEAMNALFRPIVTNLDADEYVLPGAEVGSNADEAATGILGIGPE